MDNWAKTILVGQDTHGLGSSPTRMIHAQSWRDRPFSVSDKYCIYITQLATSRADKHMRAFQHVCKLREVGASVRRVISDKKN